MVNGDSIRQRDISGAELWQVAHHRIVEMKLTFRCQLENNECNKRLGDGASLKRSLRCDGRAIGYSLSRSP